MTPEEQKGAIQAAKAARSEAQADRMEKQGVKSVTRFDSATQKNVQVTPTQLRAEASRIRAQSPAASSKASGTSAGNSGGAGAAAPAKRAAAMTIGPTGRIESAPAMLAPLARQINKLRDQRKNTQGKNGIRVTVAEGNSIISLDSGSATDVVAETLSYSDASITITIDANGVKLTNTATGDYAKIYTTGAIGCYDASSGEEFTVAPADLATTGSIIPRETGIFDGGVPMSAYVLRGPTF